MAEANESEQAGRPQSSEYGDALSDVLQDQARRDELRSSATGPKTKRTRVHPSVPPILALISIWLWFFPPSALQPVVPTIPPDQQEAGLRMEMSVQLGRILQYQSEFGRLPNGLDEVGDRREGVQYTRLNDNVFRLSGQSGDITVDYTSTEPMDEFIADATARVSGGASPTPGGAGPS